MERVRGASLKSGRGRGRCKRWRSVMAGVGGAGVRAGVGGAGVMAGGGRGRCHGWGGRGGRSNSEG